MIIRTKKTWKDFVEKDPNHARLTRRDFIERGLLTGAMSVMIPKVLAGSLIKEAMGDASVCPAPVRAGGALGQYFCNGGGSMFAYLMDNKQAEIVVNSPTAQQNYGIIPGDLVQVGGGTQGGNFVVSRSSAFGATLLAGLPGYTVPEWMNVLKKCSLGPAVGWCRNDDGGMDDLLKFFAGIGKTSFTAKDIRMGTTQTISWAAGVPAANVNRQPTVAQLASTFAITPAGQTNLATVNNSANAAQSLSALFGGMFANANRKGQQLTSTAASCGFFGTGKMADPTYGNSLFNPATIPALTSRGAGLSQAEQSILSASYRSATGELGAVVMDGNGFDYHGQTANNIGQRQVECARALMLFIAACDAAGQKGAFCIGSNGSAICDGNTPGTTLNVGATSTPGQTTLPGLAVGAAAGDSGGFFSGGWVVFYSPTGSPPTTKLIGSYNPSTGGATADPGVNSDLNGLSTLYYSAAAWLGAGTVNLSKVTAAMGKVGAQYKSLI